MKYCYPNDKVKRICKCGGVEQKCARCQKVISDCEWICNWTACMECFDQSIKRETNGSSKATSA